MSDETTRGQRIRRKLLLFGCAVAAMTVLLGFITTQYVAWQLRFHAALGEPIAWSIYAPWAVIGWMRQNWPGTEPVFAQARAICGAAAMLTAGIFLATSAGRSRRPKEHHGVHGTAEFEKVGTLRRAGLLPAKPGSNHPGLYLGVWADATGRCEYLRHSGPEHVEVMGPLRSGKTMGPAVLNLLSWPHSVYVTDPKGELYERTAGWRKLHAKNRVVRWEPGASSGSARYNFLDEVRLGTSDEYGDVATVVEAVADPSGGGLDGKDHWVPTASDLITTVTLYNLHLHRAEGRTPASLPDTRRVLQDPDNNIDALLKAMLENRLGPGGSRHQSIAEGARAMLDRAEKERSGVVSTAVRMMRLFADPVVADNSRVSDFRIADLMDHEDPVSLYVVIPESRRLQLLPLVKLFEAVAMGRLMDQNTHKRPLLWMAEEFLAKGKQTDFVDRLSRCAGAGIRAMLFIQDYPQLLDVYGSNEQVTSKCHIQIYHTPTDGKTASLISDACDRATMVTEDVSESGAPMSGQKGYSRAYHTVSRQLLTPGEVRRMRTPAKLADGTVTAPGEILMIVAGLQPIRAQQAFWFFDQTFLQRGGIAAPETDRLRSAPWRTPPRPTAAKGPLTPRPQVPPTGTGPTIRGAATPAGQASAP